MTVQVLGTGCAKCRMLYANAAEAIREAGLEVELRKVEDVQEMVNLGVMATPALAVDGVVKLSGRLATPAEIRRLLGG